MTPQDKETILRLLAQHRIMTVATVRPDGWPQATTVGYASEGLLLYFLCSKQSQKAANIVAAASARMLLRLPVLLIRLLSRQR